MNTQIFKGHKPSGKPFTIRVGEGFASLVWEEWENVGGISVPLRDDVNAPLVVKYIEHNGEAPSGIFYGNAGNHPFTNTL